jgi:hypothetical protein
MGRSQRVPAAWLPDRAGDQARASDDGQPDLPSGCDAALPGGGQLDYMV